MQKLEQKNDLTAAAGAFRRFLIWLDNGTDSDGQKYLEIRQRLVSYFDRRNCAIPDELADETLNRVARRLEEEGAIESETPAKYCYIVARFVFMEHLRETQKENLLFDHARRLGQENSLGRRAADDERETRERMLNCLEQCAEKLEPLNREIITRYYNGKERVKIDNRRRLAEELGITMNALSIRACRIRDKLELCVRECAGSK